VHYVSSDRVIEYFWSQFDAFTTVIASLEVVDWNQQFLVLMEWSL